MADKYVKLADVKRKLRYIFKVYGVGGFVREKVERALNNLPYSVKGDLETTLEAADVQPVKHGRWITKAEDYYKAWQDSGRSWDDMPYFVTGLKFACSNCFEQFDVNAEGVEKWNGCPLCLVRMDGDTE